MYISFGCHWELIRTQDIRLLGKHQHGVYDPLETVDEEKLQRHYGVEGGERERAPGQTGAGHPAEEAGDEAEWEDDHEERPRARVTPSVTDSDDTLSTCSYLTDSDISLSSSVAREIHRNIRPNVRHAPIPVGRHEDPFAAQSTALETAFFEVLNESLSNKDSSPIGYGLQRAEWEDGQYPEIEFLPVGARRQALRIELRHDIWFPRAVAWVKGLDLLSHTLAISNTHAA